MMTATPEPQRHLDLEGSYNIRDIGGYLIEDGRRTRWKTFLRSDSMHRLTPESQATLIAYGVRTVIDLRTTLETEANPNVFVGSSEVSYYHHNVIGDEPLPERELVETGLPADRIKNAYTNWLDLRHKAVYRVLSALADPAVRPTVYHCAVGKDRTGVITALLLGIAGLPKETIAEDYALTARFLLQRRLHGEVLNEGNITTWEQYQAEFCPPEGMIKVLEYLDDRYGGIEDYVRAIGLSSAQIENLRNALVEWF